MSVQTIDPLPQLENRLQVVQIKRVELFIVTLAESSCIRYQVHLVLSTNAGPFTSDIVLEASEKPADWVTWAYCFTRILDARKPYDVDWITHQFHDNSFHSRLLCSALQQLESHSKRYRNISEDRSRLFDLASCYISLF